jgi:hypothetical protein
MPFLIIRITNKMALPANNSFRLCQVAEECLQIMHLSSADAATVRQCIAHYALPDNCSGWVNWIIFCVKNIFKSCLGRMTEWQQTRKMIQDHMLERAVQGGIISRNPQNATDQKVRDLVIETLASVAERHLELCLYAQDRGSTLSVEFKAELRRRLQEVDVNQFVDQELRATMQRIYARLGTS